MLLQSIEIIHFLHIKANILMLPCNITDAPLQKDSVGNSVTVPIEMHVLQDEPASGSSTAEIESRERTRSLSPGQGSFSAPAPTQQTSSLSLVQVRFFLP